LALLRIDSCVWPQAPSLHPFSSPTRKKGTGREEAAGRTGLDTQAAQTAAEHYEKWSATAGWHWRQAVCHWLGQCSSGYRLILDRQHDLVTDSACPASLVAPHWRSQWHAVPAGVARPEHGCDGRGTAARPRPSHPCSGTCHPPGRPCVRATVLVCSFPRSAWECKRCRSAARTPRGMFRASGSRRSAAGLPLPMQSDGQGCRSYAAPVWATRSASCRPTRGASRPHWVSPFVSVGQVGAGSRWAKVLTVTISTLRTLPSSRSTPSAVTR
jgi:hypothetical protein